MRGAILIGGHRIGVDILSHDEMDRANPSDESGVPAAVCVSDIGFSATWEDVYTSDADDQCLRIHTLILSVARGMIDRFSDDDIVQVVA